MKLPPQHSLLVYTLLASALLSVPLHPTPLAWGQDISATGTSADSGDAAAERQAQERWFEQHIRPLLVAHCATCHGAEKQESDLRVDSLEALLAGGSLGPALVPGDPESSLLVQAVRYDGDLQMPPTAPLAPEQVQLLSEWVRRGAVWPERAPPGDVQLAAAADHWSLQPLRRPAVPTIDGAAAAWARTPLDHFIAARLAEAGLQPAPRAEPHTLLRRAVFDLTGLPPDPELSAEFLADTRPDAYERLVDRLLASPQHGVHMARAWLDVARYADNKGYVFFEDREYPWAYTYRDYVVDALNSDLPYDQFIKQQIAADQLPTASDPRTLAALGFLTVGGHFMNNTHDILDDRIDVITRGLLGLTVTCARCHDHKYDPISQADYYALYGVLASCYEPLVPPLLDAPPQTEEFQQYTSELSRRETALRDFVLTSHKELVEGARRRVGEYLQAVIDRRGQPAADDFMLLADKGDINPAMILRWQVYLEKKAVPDDPIWGAWQQLVQAPENEFSVHAAHVVDAWCGATGTNPLVAEALRAQPLASLNDLAACYGRLLQNIESQWQQLVTSRQAAGEPSPTGLPDPAAEALRQVLYAPDAPPNVPLTMDWGFLSLFPDRATQEDYKKLLKALEEHLAKSPASAPRAMVLLDHDQPVTPRIFMRGNPHRLGPEVPRRFLEVLSRRTATDGTSDRRADEVVSEVTVFRHGSGRLELARAIADRANPLTARVMANRIWMQLMGQGLVRTPGDFGLRGQPPTDPQLLDYLAAELIDSGYSLKHIRRLIVTSAVYQQQSDLRPDAVSRDPENLLWWRRPIRQLSFEAMRDAALSVSGQIDLQLGGPPLDLWSQELRPRRSLYGYIDRMDVPPLLTTFDFPNPSVSSPMRERTTVAPQSLYLMNHPFWLAVAQGLLQRDDVAAAQGGDRIQRVHHILLSRAATDEEVTASLEYLGSEPTNDRWVDYVHALLMTNEFVVVD